jgi:threonine synthase
MAVYLCPACSRQYELKEDRFRCECGSFLDTAPAPAAPQAQQLDNRDLTIWRYREFFGLPEDLQPVTLGEGRTPVVRKSIDGQEVDFKLDFMQPSGSFKDRGASVLVSAARYAGAASIIEDSSGNAGAAVSAYARAAGLDCTIFTPDYTPTGKLAQMRMVGSRVVKVKGTRQDTSQAAMDAAANGAFYASHLWNPLFIRGLASTALEIWEQMGAGMPHSVVLPVGSGGYYEGLHLGFSTLTAAGKIEAPPRLVGVQARHCSPLVQALEAGLEDAAPIESQPTVAEGISVQQPPRARGVLQAVRENRGALISVTEDEILASLTDLFALGLFVEPTSAAALAGWRKLSPDDQRGALLILTGSGLKQTAKLEKLFPAPL